MCITFIYNFWFDTASGERDGKRVNKWLSRPYPLTTISAQIEVGSVLKLLDDLLIVYKELPMHVDI